MSDNIRPRALLRSYLLHFIHSSCLHPRINLFLSPILLNTVLNSWQQQQEDSQIPEVCKALRSLHTNQKDDQEKGGQCSAREVTFPLSCGHAPHYKQALLPICVFWKQLSKGRNCNTQCYRCLYIPSVHKTEFWWGFFSLLSFCCQKKFPGFSTQVHSYTCSHCPWYSHGF